MKSEIIQAFILSSPRSGSTKLRLLLDAIPNVVALPETHFFNFIENEQVDFENDDSKRRIAEKWTGYYTIGKWPINKAGLIDRIVSNAVSYRDILEFTVSAYIKEVLNEDPENAYVIEKSPPHIFYRSSIQQMFPNAKFVFLIRDPRDVVASLKTCDWSTSNVVVNSRVWRNGVRTIQAEDFVVKYENLVLDSTTQMTLLSDYLGINFKSQYLDTGSKDEMEKNVKSSKNSLEPITDSFIGSYSNRLDSSRREMEIIQSICKEEMEQHNYELVPGKYGIIFLYNKLRFLLRYVLLKK